MKFLAGRRAFVAVALKELLHLWRDRRILMLVIFLIPTFSLHSYWLKVLPTMAPVVKNSISNDKAQNYFHSFDRQSYHAHEVGIRDNLVFLAAAFYFTVRGSGLFGFEGFTSFDGDHYVRKHDAWLDDPTR